MQQASANMHLLFWVSPHIWSSLALGVYSHTAKPGYSYRRVINISVLVCFVFDYCISFAQLPVMFIFYAALSSFFFSPSIQEKWGRRDLLRALHDWVATMCCGRGSAATSAGLHVKRVSSVSALRPVQTPARVFMAGDWSLGGSRASAGGPQWLLH